MTSNDLSIKVLGEPAAMMDLLRKRFRRRAEKRTRKALRYQIQNRLCFVSSPMFWVGRMVQEKLKQTSRMSS